MATVFFIWRNGKPAKGRKPTDEGKIYAQYTHNQLTSLFLSDEKLPYRQWDAERGMAKEGVTGASRARKLNKYLSDMKEEILAVATDLRGQGTEPSCENVKKAYKAAQEAKKANSPEMKLGQRPATLLEEWRKFLTDKTKIRPRTVASITNSIETMEEFLKLKGITDLPTEKFTSEYLYDYGIFLEGKYKSNTVAKRKKHLKSYFKYFIEDKGGTLKIQLAKFKFKEEYRVKASLTETELEAVKDLELIGRRAEVRDLFVLQCYLGLRVSDIKRIDRTKISDNRIRLNAQKTGAALSIPITQVVDEILKRYDYKVPQVPDQVVNDLIKGIVQEACPHSYIEIRDKSGRQSSVPLSSRITTHAGVRTCISLLAEKKMSIPAISRLTGKSQRVIMQHYLNFTQTAAEIEYRAAMGDPVKPMTANSTKDSTKTA